MTEKIRDYNVNGAMIIGVDNGYGNMKTARRCFKTALVKYDSEPVLSRDYLEYEGKFYVIGEGHKGFVADKQSDIDELKNQIQSIRQEKVSGDNIYQLLLMFDKVYYSCSEVEQKAFIEKIELYPEKREDGCWIKHITFNFPVPLDGKEFTELCLEKETTLETVVLLFRKTPDDTIEVDLGLDELDITSAESKATYQEIKDYVLKEYGLKVSTLYISQIKRKCGIDVGELYPYSQTR